MPYLRSLAVVAIVLSLNCCASDESESTDDATREATPSEDNGPSFFGTFLNGLGMVLTGVGTSGGYSGGTYCCQGRTQGPFYNQTPNASFSSTPSTPTTPTQQFNTGGCREMDYRQVRPHMMEAGRGTSPC